MELRYSRIDRLSDGFRVDSRPYVSALVDLRGSLPDGAYRFVSDPEHYDFYSERSVKDLKVERLTMVDSFAALGIKLDLAYNDLPNVPRLSIDYSDVFDLSIQVRSGYKARCDWIGAHTKRLGDILTDEVHPDEKGCVHVIEMIHGTLCVTCRDLEASWS